MARSVLVVDDEPAMREMLLSMLEAEGIQAVAAGSAEEAIDASRDSEFDAVVSDIRMPGKGGLALLDELHETKPETPVILMTAFGSIDSAVDAMRCGAFDYITKPFKRGAVIASLERAFERRALERENRQLRRALDKTTAFGDLIGASPAMHEIFALIRKVSGSKSNVLITGESGTGKEVVARTIHFTGSRARAPFVPINCTAMPEGLLESELFGHVRGAFTGAHVAKRGLFEEAAGGTLFLDEIGDMSPVLQSKLLRVLQDQEIRPVGGTKAVRVDVRVIAATNKDLKREIDEGRFRQDLFYRLNVIALHIPPLRERLEDLPVLVQAFLARHAPGKDVRVSREAFAFLSRQPWHGNARELENAIERALLLGDGRELRAEDFAPGTAEGAPVRASESGAGDWLDVALQRQLTLHDLCEEYSERVLRSVHGNKMRAAKLLGVNRRTLYRRNEARERQQSPESEHKQES
ncbi:MAG TPA: sigma-54 dependent transcriptional regulator [Myxococcota bacterium]|nr:sigma-54 dependent transcriptional regulator [Myxococcota bacterium]